MSSFGLSCDVCNRENVGITWVNGMKFCAKCYQETFGNQQNKESSELLINLLAEKDKQVAELQKQLEEKDKYTYTGKEVGEIERKYETQLEEKEKDNQFLKKMYLSERTKNDNYHTEKYGLDKSVEELRKIKLTPKEKEIYYKGFDNCERQFATHIAELQQQLKTQPAEIVEKIRQLLGLKLEYKHNENVPILKICNQINEVLDTILKQYQK